MKTLTNTQNTNIMITTKEIKDSLKTLGIKQVGVFNTTCKSAFKIYKISKDIDNRTFSDQEVEVIQKYTESINALDSLGKPEKMVTQQGVEFYISY